MLRFLFKNKKQIKYKKLPKAYKLSEVFLRTVKRQNLKLFKIIFYIHNGRQTHIFFKNTAEIIN